MDLSKLTLYPEKNVKLPLYGIMKLPANYEKVLKDKTVIKHTICPLQNKRILIHFQRLIKYPMVATLVCSV